MKSIEREISRITLVRFLFGAVFPMKNSPQLPVVSHDDELIPV